MKGRLKRKVLDAMKPALAKDVRRKIESGEIKPPVDMKATANGVWEAIRKNSLTYAAVSSLNITLEDIVVVVRNVLTELEVEVTE